MLLFNIYLFDDMCIKQLWYGCVACNYVLYFHLMTEANPATEVLCVSFFNQQTKEIAQEHALVWWHHCVCVWGGGGAL
jgi:hypothetical protein